MVKDTREFREGAEIAANYLRYLNYSIDHKQIHPKYLLRMNMQWIKHCHMLKKKLEDRGKVPQEMLNEYFPDIPYRLSNEILKIRDALREI